MIEVMMEAEKCEEEIRKTEGSKGGPDKGADKVTAPK
jgi:hypothetical protein